MFKLLRPVGEKIVFPSPGSPASAEAFQVTGYRLFFVDSGTAALALALSLLKEKSPQKNQVIIPAYCCPDILSAVLYNNLKPVLVDLEPDSTFLASDAVSDALNAQSLAIVAINFLGIPERMTALKNVAMEYDVTVIEDSAQFMPAEINPSEFEGDMVVLSFGKGKPLSLLGGGALLVAERLEVEPGAVLSQPAEFSQGALAKLKIAVYNFILHPSIYWLFSKLPFLTLGETRFHPLHEITPLKGLEGVLAENFARKKKRDVANVQLLRDRLDALPSNMMVDLSLVNAVPVGSLLRYPLLLDNQSKRDDLLIALTRAGVSASIMYRTTLCEVPGVPGELEGMSRGADDVARDFASRLLTLPTHSGLSREWVDTIVKVIARHV